MTGPGDKSEDAAQAPEGPQTRYEQAQADMRARYGERKKRYKGRWRGKPRKRRPLRGWVDAGNLVYRQLRRQIPLGAIRLRRVQERWGELVPANIAKRTQPVKLIQGRLVVAVHDNQWLHELRYLRQDIIERLGRKLPDLRIEALELKLSRQAREGRDGDAHLAPAGDQGPDPALQKRVAPLSGEIPAQTLAALDEVEDPELREAMLRARKAFGGEFA